MDTLILFFVVFAVYFLPSIVCLNRRHKNISAITTLNLLAGWTVIGWVWALVWANTDNIDLPSTSNATEIKCPDCAELIKREARVCKHCGKKFA